MHSWHYATIGVADMADALTQWRDWFGFEVTVDPYASHAEFASVWGISEQEVAQRALLRTPGVEHGQVHLVQFASTPPSVRDGAAAFDHCPKNLDIHAHNLPTLKDSLARVGAHLKNTDVSEVTAPDGTRFRELHMAGHDDTNVVLLEVMGESLPFTAKGFAGIGPVVTTVRDRAEEQAFYQNLFGLKLLNQNILAGEEIERMIGLPAGASLDVVILGEQNSHFGRIELVEYRGVDGANLYPRTSAPARGLLGVTYQCPDLGEFATTLLSQSITFESSHGRVWFASPNGFRIEVGQAS